MATSSNTAEDVKSCAALGIEGYIAKPFRLKTLEERILGYYANKRPDIVDDILKMKARA